MASDRSYYESVKERLIRYAQVDTQSINGTDAVPTTAKQFDLARMLRDELEEIGVQDVFLDEKCCVVYGKIPSNLSNVSKEHTGRDIGFIAHMDTAPDASGSGVKPWVLENYRGQDILLNEQHQIVMSPEEFPNLLQYIGQDLILTDGTTLLGGDDKASIASIMTMAEHLCRHPEIPHAGISLAFTPDEEVGGLARDLDLERFGASIAYTLDGDHLGYYEDETFNASSAEFTIRGQSVHTGTAKGIMINAADIAAEFIGMLPADERPQTTDGRQGFYHVVSCQADCENAVVKLIVRDHDPELFLKREEYLKCCSDVLKKKYGEDRITLTITPTYRNMKEVIDRVPFMIDVLKEAISNCGIDPVCEPFRGGTDGAALSFRGLPCPNLSAGYENAHGRFEYVPIQSMEKNVEILLEMCRIYANM